MRRDCSLNSPKNTSSEHVVYKNWHSKQYLYTTCSELVCFGEFNEQCLVILWVNWFKNESFWHRFTCTANIWKSFWRTYIQLNDEIFFCLFLQKALFVPSFNATLMKNCWLMGAVRWDYIIPRSNLKKKL